MPFYLFKSSYYLARQQDGILRQLGYFNGLNSYYIIRQVSKADKASEIDGEEVD